MAVNGESVRLTRSSRSLDTRLLRAFIITSICSFMAYISAITSGEVVSTREGMLRFCRSGLLHSHDCFHRGRNDASRR